MKRLAELSADVRAVRRDWRSRAQSGSAAVEFALIAPVFFLLVFGIIEVGVIFFGSCVLENATDQAARLVRTGQAQTMTQDEFRERVCGYITPVLNCDASLQIDVESYADGFGGHNFTNPITADGTLDSSLDNYSTGNAGDVVLVRVFYVWDILTPQLKPLFGNLANGDRLISATAAFRNEPFN